MYEIAKAAYLFRKRRKAKKKERLHIFTTRTIKFFALLRTHFYSSLHFQIMNFQTLFRIFSIFIVSYSTLLEYDLIWTHKWICGEIGNVCPCTWRKTDTLLEKRQEVITFQFLLENFQGDCLLWRMEKILIIITTRVR